MSVRLTVKVNDATYETLRELADRDDTTLTEIIRRSVSVYKLVDQELRDGNKLHAVSSTHPTKELAII